MKTKFFPNWLRMMAMFATLALLVAGSVASAAHADEPFTDAIISSGYGHNCTLTPSGAIHCWGYNNYHQADDQPGPFTQVSAGYMYTCALTPSGAVDCWGDNNYHQADDQLGPYTQISAGRYHTCALMPSGAVDCWGQNDYGQATDQPGPYTQVSAGNSYTCALTSSGAVDCWGQNNYGQANDQPGPYTQISAGGLHTCALTPSGAVDCWGYNFYGEATHQPGPYTQVRAGDYHNCALTQAGDVDCWGLNYYGQSVDQLGPYTQIAVGTYHNCALRTDGTLNCWGYNGYGQAATVTLAPSILPEAVIGAAYTQSIIGGGTTGATPPYTIHVVSGALPAGLTLNLDGSWSGAPAESGVFNFTAQAADANNISGTRAYALTVNSLPDLNITKTADVAAVTASDPVGFSIAVQNTGLGTANYVTLDDSLPAVPGVSWEIASQPSGDPCILTGASLSCAFGDLAPGASTGDIHITGTTTAASCGTWNNTATAQADNNDPVTGSASIFVDCAAINVSKTAVSGTVSAGDPLGFTITVTNDNSGTAHNVSVTDTLPFNPGLGPWSLSGTNAGACSMSAGILTCNFGDVAGYASKAVTLMTPTTYATCGMVSNTASVTASNDGSDQSTATVTVNCPALEVTKTPDTQTVSAGEPISFTINVDNTGAGTAKNVTLSDQLSSEMSWSANNPDCNLDVNGLLTCHFGDLAQGGNTDVTVTGDTVPAMCGTLDNAATIKMDNGPDVESNTVSVTVKCPDVTVTKEAISGTINVGDTAAFRIVVSNSGSGTAYYVTLTDTLPAGVTWTIDPDVTECSMTGGVLSCSWTSLSAGASVTINVSGATSVAICGKLDNTVIVAASNEAANQTNNQASASITVNCISITISGLKFNDLNGNGTKDADEAGLSGWTINLYRLPNTITPAQTATTGTDGSYSFPNLGAGTYRVREALQPGWVQTTADPTDITAQSWVDVPGVNFGNTQMAKPVTTIGLTPSAPNGLNGWYQTDVLVAISATDAHLIAETRCALDPVTAPISFADLPETNCPYLDSGSSVTTEGQHTLYAASKDSYSYVESPLQSISFKIDKTAPTLNPSVAPNPIVLNGSATTSPYASDDISNIASSSCGVVDTSSVGSHTVICTATDNAGNTASASATYSVIYNFSNFLAPVDNNGVLNIAKAGQTIPLKFRITDANGNPVTNLTSVSVTAVSLSCSAGTTTDQIEEYASGGSGLQNLGDGYYQWNWKTPTTYANSCKTLRLDLGEGFVHIALFQFKK